MCDRGEKQEEETIEPASEGGAMATLLALSLSGSAAVRTRLPAVLMPSPQQLTLPALPAAPAAELPVVPAAETLLPIPGSDEEEN